MLRLQRILPALALALPSLSHAGYLPYGLQSNVSADTVSGWGWSQCYRSKRSYSASISQTILPACVGDYLMLGLYNDRTKTYAVLGAGDFDIVSAFAGSNTTLTANNVQALDNWSNGLNFYRATQYAALQGITIGQWGFTTSSVVSLYMNQNILLANGYYWNESSGGAPSAGLNFATVDDSIAHAVYYNTNGNNYNPVRDYLDPVLLNLSGPASNIPPGSSPDPGNGGNPGILPVPEPTTLALFSLGMAGMGLASRRKHRISSSFFGEAVITFNAVSTAKQAARPFF